MIDIDAMVADLQAELACGQVQYHEHKYRGGLPPMRLRRMHLQHEGRARRSGLKWEMVDFRTVYKRYRGLCGICGEEVAFGRFAVDHIVPLSAGGSHTLANLQPAHGPCNSRKGKKLMKPVVTPDDLMYPI